MLHQTEMESRLVSYFRACAEFTPPPYRLNSVNFDVFSQPSHNGMGLTVLCPSLARPISWFNSQVVAGGWSCASYHSRCYVEYIVLLLHTSDYVQWSLAWSGNVTQDVEIEVSLTHPFYAYSRG